MTKSLEKSQNLLKLLKSTLSPNDHNWWLTTNNCYIEVNDAVLRCSMKIYDVAFRWVSQYVGNKNKEIDQLTNASR